MGAVKFSMPLISSSFLGEVLCIFTHRCLLPHVSFYVKFPSLCIIIVLISCHVVVYLGAKFAFFYFLCAAAVKLL